MRSHSKQPTEHGESPSAAEEWQLRILQELHKKKPRPTVEQRKLLAAQTGLDAKWIARWFKQVNNSASKSKLKTGTVGCHLSRSQTAPPTQSIDGPNTVKSPSENLAESTTSGTGTPPSVFSAPLAHTYLFSSSGVQVTPENGKSPTGHSPYHSRLHSSGWELEHPAVAPDLLQGNRELERPLFYPHSHDVNPGAIPRPHMDLVDTQLRLGIVTNSPVYLASQALPPFRHGTPSPNTGTGVDSVKYRNPHASPSLASTPPDPLQTPTRYVHVNLVSERLDPAYAELRLGYLRSDLGPGPGVGVRAGMEAEGTGRHVDLSQAQAVSDFVAPTGSQLGPSESSTPAPSMYWLLFDTELASVVDRERDEVVSWSSSSGNDRTMEPHVTPTPISFFAKWEDMLALERRIRSSSHNAKPAQSKRIQAVHTVEPNCTRQQSGTVDRIHCGPGRDR